MTAETRACPYCNSLVPLPAGGPSRLECPRCGETFAVRSEGVAAGPPPHSPTPAVHSENVAPGPPPPSPAPGDPLPPRPGFLRATRSGAAFSLAVLGVLTIAVSFVLQ